MSRCSLARSRNVFTLSDRTRRILPRACLPMRRMYPLEPLPPSSTSACSPPPRVAGTQADDTPLTGKRDGEVTSMRVLPSRQEFGILKASVWTSSTPALRKASTAQSTARSIPGVPGILGPISSQRTPRFCLRECDSETRPSNASAGAPPGSDPSGCNPAPSPSSRTAAGKRALRGEAIDQGGSSEVTSLSSAAGANCVYSSRRRYRASGGRLLFRKMGSKPP